MEDMNRLSGYWEAMVPEPIRKRFPTISGALDFLEEQSESQESALSLFWKIYDLSKTQLLPSLETFNEEILVRIDNLERKLKEEIEEVSWQKECANMYKRGIWQSEKSKKYWCEELKVDRPKRASKLFVYIHVAGSLIIMLETKKTSHSERFTETLKHISGIEAFWEYAFSSDEYEDAAYTLSDPFGSSRYALIPITESRLFEIDDNSGRWKQALYDVESYLLWAAVFPDVGDNLDPQAPVNTFEKVWDNPDKVEDWARLASCCNSIADGYAKLAAWYCELLRPYLERDELLRPDLERDELQRFCELSDRNPEQKMVKWKGEEMSIYHFWCYAEGLCKGRLSPTEYTKLREYDEKQASEKRLKDYFFYDCWDNIPKAIQGELIAIDRLWFSPGPINLGGILEDLKVVTEPLIRKLLWEPFIQWRSSSHKTDIKALKQEYDFDKRLQKLQERNHTPSISHFMNMLKLASFRREFIQQVAFSQGDREFIFKLAEPLKELNRMRTPRAHPPGIPKNWQRDDLASLLNKFLGIDCQGILPFLARMLKKASTQNRGKP